MRKFFRRLRRRPVPSAPPPMPMADELPPRSRDRIVTGPAVVFCTTCKNRTQHLRVTLPQNLKDNPESKFVVLDYGSEDDLVPFLQDNHSQDINRGKLIVYTHRDTPVFHMAHAKNMAHRCGIMEGADILVTLDADNYAGLGFETYVKHKFNVDRDLSFIRPEFEALPRVGHRYDKENPLHLGRGFAGRLAIRANDFLKAGGYNQVFDTWRGEDIDILARLDRIGLKTGVIDSAYLRAVNHSTHVRFQEWPEAQKYENNEIYSITKQATDTVVNYGNVGCGNVFRNWGNEAITIKPIPTRIFGIGFQRTATSSLHEAFQILGYDSAHWKSAAWAQCIWREMNRWGRSATLEQANAICDNPIPLLYKQLDEAYPGSKFILTVRDEEQWLNSVEKFWTYESNPYRWTWDTDGFSHKVHAMIYGRIDYDRETFLARYRKHNDEVREYFADRPDDFLELHMNGVDPWVKLCAFLDKPVPPIAYPRVMVTREQPAA